MKVKPKFSGIKKSAGNPSFLIDFLADQSTYSLSSSGKIVAVSSSRVFP